MNPKLRRWTREEKRIAWDAATAQEARTALAAAGYDRTISAVRQKRWGIVGDRGRGGPSSWCAAIRPRYNQHAARTLAAAIEAECAAKGGMTHAAYERLLRQFGES